MKTPLVTASPGRRIQLEEIDPDATGKWKKEAAAERLAEVLEKISALQEILYAARERSLLLVFQAMDTGGKDGVIKAVCGGLNPAGLQVHSFKAPTAEELAHDFLWRVHHVVPGKGMIGVWNRSHYEDVLIVRVHRLVPEKVWKARYAQINGFEEMLTANGTTILKFMLHISKAEQKERLQARLADPTKHWKFNPDDLKERALWDDYQQAYEDAINACTTKSALWHIVPANHKWMRNLCVAELLLETLEGIDLKYPKPTFDPKTIVIE